MAFNNTVVARAAASIWGLKLGYTTTQAILAQLNANGGNLDAIVNAAFNDSYSATSTANIAAVLASNLGLTGQAATDGAAYVVDQLAGVPADQRGAALLDIVDLFSTLGADPVYGAAANAFNSKVAAAVAYSSTVGTQDAVLGNLPSGNSFELGMGIDNMTGTAGNDMFMAYIFNNSNSLQSGDFMDGGAGTDTLYADMGSSQNFAVAPRTVNVENFVVRAQSRASDTGDNNIPGGGDGGQQGNSGNRVDIDAERMVGLRRVESNNSRADVIIEDLRSPEQLGLRTADVTVAFTQSDPGNVDFGVYFDQHSLIATTSSTAVLNLQVIDAKGASEDPSRPLRDSPFDAVSFFVGASSIELKSQAINDAQTYPQLLAAIQAVAATVPALANVVFSLGASFNVTVNSSDGQTYNATGTAITVTATNQTLAPGFWNASQGIPGNSALYVNQIPGGSSAQALVISTVILDDVGRGSNGGDLVIGGLSVGETSGSRGVDRFDITVERASRLQTINSTNNWLKEVVIKNGAASTTASSLSLSVLGANGFLGGTGGYNANHAGGEQLPGTEGQHNNWGFSDVRLIDASQMTGAISFDAEVTPASFAKYIITTDTDPNPGDDNTSNPGEIKQVADFKYSGGAGNDSINVQIDGGIVSSNSNVMVGREDFTFVLNGNAGDDNITLRMITPDLPGQENWYLNHKPLANVSINGGTGNDTVRTPGAGDVRIDLGAGADTVYADNTGAQDLVFNNLNIGVADDLGTFGNAGRAIWVMNEQQGVAGAKIISNLQSDSTQETALQDLYRAALTVTYKGLESTINLPVNVYAVSDLYINQAIKSAINNDPVLKKLLVAEDGPTYSLVVRSLIDGVQAVTDLNVTVQKAAVSNLTGAEVFAALASYDPATDYGSASNAANLAAARVALDAIFDTAVTAFNDVLPANADYRPEFATDEAANDIVGADSLTTSDNTITGGADNDVIVMGTTNNGTRINSSNDIAVYTNAPFGNDTIVHFVAGAGPDRDQLSFVAVGASVTNAGRLDSSATFGSLMADDSILSTVSQTVIVRLSDVDSDEASEIVQYFQDGGVSPTITSRTNVYIAVDGDNIGSVYRILDVAGADNVTATFLGTIDLADTDWFDLTFNNFATNNA